ncbi:LysR family transcriptional regulator [Nonomuraea soli]|uniref:DNA-binding transcriptional LysR family regulator n=1 Tax=Nonomuraea soli TaxID=1032476 RepID=A0A7W0CDS0_9ACTN|nr:LysR family transcriptional regulator [Nonomuraea soli]MBA2889264.1 DNA-binding transcriptional LysR family regulator [Nonomuraea soli]
MDLELRHLRIVRAVADAGSVSKAATRLGLAQPALTAQLKRIERLLGGALFERDRTGARPTPLGELVLDRAKVLLPAAKELQDEAVRFANGPTTGYRIGATAGNVLGGLVDRLAGHGPVRTSTSWSANELATMAELGRLDFVLVGVCGDAGPPGESISWGTIGTDPVFVMVGEGHRLSGQHDVELSDLAGEYWAVNPGDGCFGDCFAAACARAGFTPGTMYETDVATCYHLARVGRAVVLCQATHRPAPGLVMLPLRGAPLRWRHLLGWHPSTPGASWVLAQARLAHQEAVRQSPVYDAWLVHNPVIGAKW